MTAFEGVDIAPSVSVFASVTLSPICIAWPERRSIAIPVEFRNRLMEVAAQRTVLESDAGD
ncbi:hypothetical protein PQR34_15045 [Paraburkholderia sediminicola]|uniref:hypothetical protein n=1 Tax=Paraburkholderia sediminicola TaxID=458836 RepID=UPI000E7519FC